MGGVLSRNSGSKAIITSSWRLGFRESADVGVKRLGVTRYQYWLGASRVIILLRTEAGLQSRENKERRRRVNILS